MTEDQAREVVLLMARETARGPSHDHHTLWSPADRDWATRQALATVGEQAAPEAFVTARATLALQRLLPRDDAARRWLQRRVWHAGWLVLALLLGLLLGVAVDQLGPPQRVNLLAPAVWAVVAWNLLVYAALLWPAGATGPEGWRARLAAWFESRDGFAADWARLAGPLSVQRLTLLMHTAAAALALGLILGLYLRGLVLDYRAGWQSTFLSADAVQTLLGLLLAPAGWVTGIGVPAVAPLQLAPGGVAQASAAAWIHLYGATLLLAVVLPRTLLALRAAWAARRLAAHFVLPLNTAYFEGLHPLMRPGPPRPLRLLWLPLAPTPPVRLFDTLVDAPTAPTALLASPEGERLLLLPTPTLLQQAEPDPPRPWWQFWRGASATEQAAQALQTQVDVVALVCTPEQPRPAWLATLARPLILLNDDRTATPPALPLRQLADGWLPCGVLLQALDTALPDELRWQRLAQAWRTRAQQRLDGSMQIIATGLARIASMRVPLSETGLLGKRHDAEPARAALAQALEEELQRVAEELARFWGAPGKALPPAATNTPTLNQKLGEGRAALLGGVLSGALAGLKADIATGGLTMGAGAVAGSVIGALGAAGVARGLNAARGTEHSHASWDEATLNNLCAALLQQHLLLASALSPEEAAAALQRALPAQQSAINTLWQGRAKGGAPQAHEVQRISAALAPLLAHAVRIALGGPDAWVPRQADAAYTGAT
jgi:Protein of unknown function (DUF2868)/Domain of unknown function (DUF3482)